MFEINPEHEFYHLTAMIKEGMRSSIQSTMDASGQVSYRLSPATVWMLYMQLWSHEYIPTVFLNRTHCQLIILRQRTLKVMR